MSLTGPDRRPEPGFDLGRVTITVTAKAALDEADVLNALDRHASGDWGELDEADQGMNEHALSHGGRVLSKYTDSNDQAFYIISENLGGANHTTVLLPEDY